VYCASHYRISCSDLILRFIPQYLCNIQGYTHVSLLPVMVPGFFLPSVSLRL
jgi:hypothetical protein